MSVSGPPPQPSPAPRSDIISQHWSMLLLAGPVAGSSPPALMSCHSSPRVSTPSVSSSVSLVVLVTLLIHAMPLCLGVPVTSVRPSGPAPLLCLSRAACWQDFGVFLSVMLVDVTGQGNLFLSPMRASACTWAMATPQLPILLTVPSAMCLPAASGSQLLARSVPLRGGSWTLPGAFCHQPAPCSALSLPSPTLPLYMLFYFLILFHTPPLSPILKSHNLPAYSIPLFPESVLSLPILLGHP